MTLSGKRILALLLIMTMTITLLTACGSEKVKDTDSKKEVEVTQAPKESDTVKEEEEVVRDLGGMEIILANWWEADPPNPPSTQMEEDTLSYREAMMEKHNFKLKTVNIGSWGEYAEIVITSIMSGAPAADIFIMDPQFVPAPLQQGLLYPLNKLESINFADEKWNKQVLEMMKFGDDIFAMASGRKEPRLGVFWNKRLFEEAGLDPDLPYDLQASGEWTWDAMKKIAKKTTRDTDNDGIADTYGIASFSIDFFRGAVFSNNAKFIGKDDNGMFYNATGEANFIEAIQWARSFYDENLNMPQPDDSNWDWFIAAFKDGNVAMQPAEEFKTGMWSEMEDDWGFVIFPAGPQGNMMTIFSDNLAVMPATLSKDYAENVAFVYNLYTETTPGYEDQDWKAPYYTKYRDVRAVEETLPLFYKPEHGTFSYLRLIGNIDYGDITFGVEAGSSTPAEAIEKVMQEWSSYIDKANGLDTN